MFLTRNFVHPSVLSEVEGRSNGGW